MQYLILSPIPASLNAELFPPWEKVISHGSAVGHWALAGRYTCSCGAIRMHFPAAPKWLVTLHLRLDGLKLSMSKDCSIEFNSQLYPGFIDLHGLSSDSGVSTLKMTLGHMQQVQNQALMVKGSVLAKLFYTGGHFHWCCLATLP